MPWVTQPSVALPTCLRLGAPYRCSACQCGEAVDCLGHHGFSCRKSAGRIARHASMNDLIRSALAIAGVPAVLEPKGLARDDGKRPDGMAIMPWKLGRRLVWDATCVDNLAPSHLPSTACSALVSERLLQVLKTSNDENTIT